MEDMTAGLRRPLTFPLNCPTIFPAEVNNSLPTPWEVRGARRFARTYSRPLCSPLTWSHRTSSSLKILAPLPPELQHAWPLSIHQLLQKSHKPTRFDVAPSSAWQNDAACTWGRGGGWLRGLLEFMTPHIEPAHRFSCALRTCKHCVIVQAGSIFYSGGPNNVNLINQN